MSSSSTHFGEENVCSLQYAFSHFKTETQVASKPAGSIILAEAGEG